MWHALLVGDNSTQFPLYFPKSLNLSTHLPQFEQSPGGSTSADLAVLPNCVTFVAVNNNFSVAVPRALVVRLVRGQDRGKEVYIPDNTS